MKITKLGHCALIIEHKGVKLLTDPGSYTVEQQANLTRLDAVLITHEHADHLHMESVAALIAGNPNVQIISNSSVAKLLAEKDIACTVVGDNEATTVKGLLIEGFGTEHAPIYETFGLVENTGYFIGDQLYFPGDNFYAPGKKVDVLALPVAGPWMKISMAIEFAKTVKAKRAFGVHDGMLAPGFRGLAYSLLKLFAPETECIEIKDGESREF